jgi:hypothetical protein
MDLRYQLTCFADILASSKYTGPDYSSCDYRDIDAAIARAKEETKAEIGALLLKVLAEEEKKRAALRIVR